MDSQSIERVRENQSNYQPDTKEEQPKIALGVGNIIGESFSILFRNIILVIVVGLAPSLLGYLRPGLVYFLDGFGYQYLQFRAGFGLVSSIAMIFIQVSVFLLTSALLVQLAYDAKFSRPIKLSRYFEPAIRALPYILILSIAALFLTVVSVISGRLAIAFGTPFAVVFAALFALNLWTVSVFSVMAPAILIERIGFRCLKRSAELTRNYRWQIAGTLVIAGSCYALIVFATGSIFTFPDSAFSFTRTVSTTIAAAVISTIGNSLVGIIIALIYARLREIKNGMTIDRISEVFD